MKQFFLLILATLLSLSALAQRGFTPSPRDFLVDASLSDKYCAAHPYVFNSFNEAAAHLTEGKRENPMTVYIAPGVYWIDDPDDSAIRVGENGREPFGLVIRCNALRLIGLSDDPRDVVLASARGQMQGAYGNFTMLDITSDDFLVENMTLGNFCNVDLVYPRDPSLNRPKRNSAITQAHIAYLHGDRAVARNVRFISRLNMNPLNGARRILFDRCHMESTDDALTGTGVYLNCDLDFYAPRPFWCTHENGAVFLNCDFNIRHSSGHQYFCKSVGPVSLIDCRFHGPDSTELGWTRYPQPWLRCYTSGVTFNGRPAQIGAAMPENTVDISERFLIHAFKIARSDSTLYNTFNLLRGEDDWDPLGVKEFSTDIPTYYDIFPREASVMSGDSLMLTVRAFRHGGYPMEVPDASWEILSAGRPFASNFYLGNVRRGYEFFNDTDTVATVVIRCRSALGLEGEAVIKVTPQPLPAPEFLRKPTVTVRNRKAVVDYELDLGSRADRSEISWYRDGRLVAVSRYGVPMKEYPLTRDDAGHVISARVRPAHIRSVEAEAVEAPGVKITETDVDPSLTLFTDFANFPTAETDIVAPGSWTVGGFKPADTEQYKWAEEEGEYWYYGTGINGATGRGLSQRRKGARLMYTPLEGNYSAMDLKLLVDPAKTAGQGFGSATGQYLDVAIKFDPSTLTGYALRIIRTTEFSNAVSFLLVEYRDGQVTPLTDAVPATCYRTGCLIRVGYRDGRLSADVTTSTPLSPPTDPRLSTEVHLSCEVPGNPFGGLAIQHTGSTGESATMLHSLRVGWESEKK